MNTTTTFELPAIKFALTDPVDDSGTLLVSIVQSSQFPGYFNCRVFGVGGSFATHLPVAACAVGLQLDCMLDGYGRASSDIRWTARTETQQGADSLVREVVYFARAGDFIKIGKSTGSAEDRIACLQTGCPLPITVLATVQGGRKLEAELHRRFASLRAHGEWFHVAPLLLSFIEGLALAGEQQ